MELTHSFGTITIKGNIKSISDFQEIKNICDSAVLANKSLHIDVVDSLSMTSSVIGYFTKLILKDNIDLRISVTNEQLFHLLDDLNLVSLFHVKKV